MCPDYKGQQCYSQGMDHSSHWWSESNNVLVHSISSMHRNLHLGGVIYHISSEINSFSVSFKSLAFLIIHFSVSHTSTFIPVHYFAREPDQLAWKRRICGFLNYPMTMLFELVDFSCHECEQKSIWYSFGGQGKNTWHQSHQWLKSCSLWAWTKIKPRISIPSMEYWTLCDHHLPLGLFTFLIMWTLNVEECILL